MFSGRVAKGLAAMLFRVLVYISKHRNKSTFWGADGHEIKIMVGRGVVGGKLVRTALVFSRVIADFITGHIFVEEDLKWVVVIGQGFGWQMGH